LIGKTYRYAPDPSSRSTMTSLPGRGRKNVVSVAVPQKVVQSEQILERERLPEVGDGVTHDEIVFSILHFCDSNRSGWFFPIQATTLRCSSAAVLIANSSSCFETLPAES
jgi:hypothetical protein